MDALKNVEGKQPENNYLFQPVKKPDDSSLVPSHLEILQVVDDHDDDDDAWMREDAVSLEDDGDDEKQESLPFGLNQSWPRVSRLSYRQGISPRVQHPKKKLLRQISQESLDESTSLLLGHIVMLPETPQDLVLDAGLPMDLNLGPGLSKFPQHPLVEEEGEELHEHKEESVNLLEPDNDQKAILKSEFLCKELSGDQVTAGKVSDDQLSCDRLSTGQELGTCNPASSDSASGTQPKVVLSDLESIERDCCETESQQIFPAQFDRVKSVGENVTVTNREQLGDLSESSKCEELREPEIDEAKQSPKDGSHTLVEPSNEIIANEHSVDTGSKDVLKNLALNNFQTIAIDRSNQDMQFNDSDQVGLNDVQEETSDNNFYPEQTEVDTDITTSRERVVRKKSSPGGRKQRPLLRYLSQESIEESTNLLMDHVVMMDLQASEKQMSPERKDQQCPFLVDIVESPLLDEDAIGGVGTDNEEEEMFLYRGDIDSCDEEDDVDDDALLTL